MALKGKNDKMYKENTTKLIAKWISKCPVNFVKKEEIPSGFVYPNGEITLTLTRERKKVNESKNIYNERTIKGEYDSKA